MLKVPRVCPDDIRFRQLLETLPAGAYVCDPEGLITYFNRHAVRLWGRAPKLNDPADRWCGSFKLFLTDGTPIRHDQCWMAKAIQTGDEFVGREILVERPDGTRATVLAHASPVRDEDGRLLGAVNVLVDLSDLKRAEAERDAHVADLSRLHETSVQLSHTLELKPILEGILRTAAAIDGTDLGFISLVESNHLTIAACLGFSDQFVQEIGHLAPGDAASGTCFLRRERVVIQDVEIDPLYASFRAIANRAGFRAVHSTPLIARDGRLLGVLSTNFRQPHRPGRREMHLIDLLARQAVDAIENFRLVRSLQEADRKKDEFLAILAHELRNPLAPICNSAYLLQARAPADPIVEAARSVIDRQAKQLTRLVNDLLDLSRVTTGKLELQLSRIDLRDVIRAALETSRSSIDAAGLTLDVHIPSNALWLDGDAMRLAQAVGNLLSNAARYTDRDGRVTLIVERQGSDAVVMVRDTGIGIPADMLTRIFDMFTQAHRDRVAGGLGLGLTLVKTIVEMHGGSVQARSDGPDKGSEFMIRLPLLIGVEKPTKALRGGSPLRVLVVDDNRDMVTSVAVMLRLLGHEVREAFDGEEAIAVAADFRPDVVLLDIGLPRLNGYETAERMRATSSGRAATLIATTGWSQSTDREQSRAAGFDHHLVKPVDPAELIGLLAVEAKRRSGQFAAPRI